MSLQETFDSQSPSRTLFTSSILLPVATGSWTSRNFRHARIFDNFNRGLSAGYVTPDLFLDPSLMTRFIEESLYVNGILYSRDESKSPKRAGCGIPKVTGIFQYNSSQNSSNIFARQI